jgi:hypothetical protein
MKPHKAFILNIRTYIVVLTLWSVFFVPSRFKQLQISSGTLNTKKQWQTNAESKASST